jgi:hypothetical protein
MVAIAVEHTERSCRLVYRPPRTTELAVGEVLEIVGKPAPQLDWFDLYKVYEIICDDVGGKYAIIANGWATGGALWDGSSSTDT